MLTAVSCLSPVKTQSWIPASRRAVIVSGTPSCSLSSIPVAPGVIKHTRVHIYSDKNSCFISPKPCQAGQWLLKCLPCSRLCLAPRIWQWNRQSWSLPSWSSEPCWIRIFNWALWGQKPRVPWEHIPGDSNFIWKVRERLGEEVPFKLRPGT